MSMLLVLAYGITIVASAVAGGYLPQVIRMNHFRMQVLLSFIGGMMLGVAVLHLFAHGFEQIYDAAVETAQITGDEANALDCVHETLIAMMAGLLLTFFLMRAFHFHQHGEDIEGEHREAEPCHHHQDPHSKPTRMGWVGVMLGLGLHTFIDGVALGAAVVAEQEHQLMAGFGVYIAILLHKPLDALSISTLMTADKRSPATIHCATAGFGLMAVLGALSVVWFQEFHASGTTLGYLLAASSGVFVCISLSDLLPEVQFHRHDRVSLSAALLLGIAAAWVLESFHAH